MMMLLIAISLIINNFIIFIRCGNNTHNSRSYIALIDWNNFDQTKTKSDLGQYVYIKHRHKAIDLIPSFIDIVIAGPVSKTKNLSVFQSIQSTLRHISWFMNHR